MGELSKLPNIGKAVEKQLEEAGISTYEELKKIAKVIGREYPEANTEVFLVLDATTGQNALQQAKLFNEVADITGLVLTKLDGTAKGGIVIAIKNEMSIPVRYIGVGEGVGDLQAFDPAEFSKALFEK